MPVTYTIPKEFYFPLHQPKPKFKDDVENVLMYMAMEISKIPEQTKESFMKQVNQAIRRFPGNLDRNIKTINNWRTEISSFFGFIEYNANLSICEPGRVAIKLANNQDLVEFFRTFLYFFEFPGAYKKSHSIASMIQAGIRFKPIKYILSLLKYAEGASGHRFDLSKAETTHCILDDLRVTRDCRAIEETYTLIKNNRINHVTYNTNAQVTRYAKDILDYMVFASLLVQGRNRNYHLNHSSMNVINKFIESDVCFNGYEDLYESDFNLTDIQKRTDAWYKYVNQDIPEDFFKTNIEEYLQVMQETASKPLADSVRTLLRQIKETQIDTKLIGDYGENIIVIHEKNWLSQNGRDDIKHKVQKIPDKLGIGYDILSAELDEAQKFVEVKTTISKKKIVLNQFHLTTNEWVAAEGYGDRYFVYRVMLSESEIKLFIIKNPVRKYKTDQLKMVPRDGADITFDYSVGEWQDLLL